MRNLPKIPCPNCGNLLVADIHAPQDGAIWVGELPKIALEQFRDMDIFECSNCDNFYTRADLNE